MTGTSNKDSRDVLSKQLNEWYESQGLTPRQLAQTELANWFGEQFDQRMFEQLTKEEE